MSRSAAFFDPDKTLLRRSSTLALAPHFRRHGVIAAARGWPVLRFTQRAA